MEETKEKGTVTQFATDEESPFDQHVTPEKRGSPEDQRDMYRMGKAQELRVWHTSQQVLRGKAAWLIVARSEISGLFPFLGFP